MESMQLEKPAENTFCWRVEKIEARVEIWMIQFSLQG